MFKHEATKQSVYHTKALQDGDALRHRTIPQQGNVGIDGGSVGRLTLRTNPPNASTLPRVQLQRGRLQVRCTAVRTFLLTRSVYPRGRRSIKRPSSERYSPLRILRRLFCTGRILPRYGGQHRPFSKSPDTPGMHYQHGDIELDTESRSQVPRGPSRFHRRDDLYGTGLVTTLRVDDQPSRHHPILQAADETNPGRPVEILQTRPGKTGSDVTTRATTPTLMATSENSAKGKPFHQERSLTPITSDASLTVWRRSARHSQYRGLKKLPY